MVCRRVFGSAKLLAQEVLEPYGIIPCFLGAFWELFRRVLDSTKMLAQLSLEPHVSILCFLRGVLACVLQCRVVGASGT